MSQSLVFSINMGNEIFTFGIRQEQPADKDEIYQLIRTAFETADVKDGDEQDYAVELRNSSHYIPELALVAEKDGKLIGHIMLTETTLTQPDGSVVIVLLLSPLSVLLEYRNRQIGGRLIEEACKRAVPMGYRAVFLCGDPAYYNRFGFWQTSLFSIYPENPIPEQYVLVRELEDNFLQSVSGKIACC